jgi:uncharacterized membrane protein
MEGLGPLIFAAAVFVASHFLLSHPLRRPLVQRLGEGTFLGVYSIVAAVALTAMVWAVMAAPSTAPIWRVGNTLWAASTTVMLLASVMLMGSLIGNPALPSGSHPAKAPASARGVFAITRHPMMWSFSLSGFCHIAVYPIAKNIVVAFAVITLALVGSALQDRKKEQLCPGRWRAWEAKTSYRPFAAIITHRTRVAGSAYTHSEVAS